MNLRHEAERVCWAPYEPHLKMNNVRGQYNAKRLNALVPISDSVKPHPATGTLLCTRSARCIQYGSLYEGGQIRCQRQTRFAHPNLIGC